MYEFRSSCRSAVRDLKRVLNDGASSLEFRLQVRFSDRLSFGNAKMYKYLDIKNLDRVIMAVGWMNCPSIRSFQPVSDKWIFELFETGYHEFEHMGQWYDALCSEVPQSYLYACAHFGCRYNEMYYRTHYNHNITEIRAEKFGIQNSFGFLKERNPDFDFELLVPAYVNRNIVRGRMRRDHLLYCLDYGEKDFREYKSMSELNSAFEEMEFRSLNVSQPYPEDRVMCMDEFTWIMNRNDPPEGYDEFFRMFQNEPSPIKQMEMLASLSAWLHPEEASLFPCFSDGRILPERVFGKSFPESRESAMARNLNTVKPKLWKRQNADENSFLDTFLQKAEQMENGWNALPGPDGPDFL